MADLEKIYELREIALEALKGVEDPEIARVVVEDFRTRLQNLGVVISEQPLNGIAGEWKRGKQWSAFIQTVANGENPAAHIEFAERPEGLDM